MPRFNGQLPNDAMSEALNALIDDTLSPKELADVTNKHVKTVYGWLHGTSAPSLDELKLILRRLPEPKAVLLARLVVSDLIAGAPLTAFVEGATTAPTNGDVNRDGRVDASDVVVATVNIGQSQQSSLEIITAGAMDDRFDSAEKARSLAVFDEQEKRIRVAKAALNLVT